MGQVGVGGMGGFSLPSPRPLCSKYLEVPSLEVAPQGHTAGMWQRQNLNLSPFQIPGTTVAALQPRSPVY